MLVATAGHVDHGKTSVVKHLTGTDTDRLAEEQKRGLTIELGYAFRDVGDAGQQEPIGFIDVPGHHRFINAMISGISGIDLGLLVVAADDGPMPQTLEHLDVLKLLGVRRFAAVITKSDLVDTQRLEDVVKQTRALIPDAPLCKISNRTGDGLDELKSLLETQRLRCEARNTEAQFRMYIDRVFTKKGAGVVVTGTCLSGLVEVGQELSLHTGLSLDGTAHKVRVREVHSQGRSSGKGQAGQRCALNIAGKVTQHEVQRGDFLCAHPSALPSLRLDTRCWTVTREDYAFKHLGRVKVHIGSRRVSARTYLLDRDQTAQAGQRIQLILDKEVLAFCGDRFVIRRDNESATLGGGIVIDPVAMPWGKSRAKSHAQYHNRRFQILNAMEHERPEDALQQLLFACQEIVSVEQIKRNWNLSVEETEHLLARPRFAAEKLTRLAGKDQLLISTELWQNYEAALAQQLAQWHSAKPMETGIGPAALQALLLEQIPPLMFKAILEQEVREGRIVFDGQLVRAASHNASLSLQEQKDWQTVEALMKKSGHHLLLRSEIMSATGFTAKRLQSLVHPRIKNTQLLEVGEKRLALPDTIVELAKLVLEQIEKSGDISVVEAKQIFDLGRNVTIEILEFLDGIGLTRRSANVRLIANPDAAKRYVL